MTDDFRKPPEPYRGPERRKGGDLRQGHDRRDMIRFVQDKARRPMCTRSTRGRRNTVMDETDHVPMMKENRLLEG